MVSVIVPIYNAEQYLKRCVDSILNQTYSDIEILLVDDGSTDGSRIICEQYAKQDSRVRYIQKENEGIGRTRFFAVQKVQGEYFCFIDSDDYMAENAVEVLVNNMSDDVDCVIAQHERFGESPNIKQVLLPEGLVEFFDSDYYNYLDEILRCRHAVEQWNKLYRTSLAQDVWKIPMTVKYGSDILYTMTYLSGCRAIKCISDVTYFYEYRENSLARSSSKTMILPQFMQSCMDLEDIICESFDMRELYPLLVAYVATISLVKYVSGDDANKTKTIEDIESLSNFETMKQYAKVFMKNKKAYLKTYKVDHTRFYEYWSFYKSILCGDAWYYTRLYPALLEKNKIYVVKAIVNKLIGRIKK